MRKLSIGFVLLQILFPVLFLGCSNSSQTAENIITIDLIEATKTVKSLNLSELVDNVEYVKLETTEECSFGVARYLVTDHYIVVYGRYTASVLLFSRQGKFLRSIGKKGQGPGEFYRVSNVIAFPEEDCLIIHDGGAAKIIKYTITGQFVQEQSFPRTEGRLSNISVLGPDRFALVFWRPEVETENFQVVQIRNKNFEIVDALDPISSKLVESSTGSNRYSFYIKDEIIHFRKNYFDTLYVNRGDAFIPEYYFWIKENAEPNNNIAERPSRARCNRLGEQFELGDYLVCNLTTPGEEEDEIVGLSIIYNQETGDLFKLGCFIYGNSVETAIYNDVDGIHHIYMSSSVNISITHFSEDLIYKAIDMIDLKSYIEEDLHKDIKVKMPQKQNKLIELIQKSSIDDNPILQIFHLK